MRLKNSDIPKGWAVRPLRRGQKAKDAATCGACGLSWDDGKSTSMTPAPSGRCPFEAFHVHEEEPQTPGELFYKEGHNDGQIYGRDGRTLAIIPNNHKIGKMFAAAPKMLAALKIVDEIGRRAGRISKRDWLIVLNAIAEAEEN